MAIATEVVSSVSLSGGTNYRAFAITATATVGDVIHTATTTSGQLDEIWVWANNRDNSVTRTLTIEISVSAAGALDEVFEYAIPNELGSYKVVPGWRLSGGASLRAFGSDSSAFVVVGYVNRITS